MLNSNYQFSESEVNKLKQCRDHCQNIRLKERFIALVLFATLSISKIQIAEILGKSQRTIENWLTIYFAEGVEGLNNFKYKSKKSFLNFYQQNQVKIYVSFNNPETVKEVSDYIEKAFEVKYSNEGTRKLLKKLGLKVMKTKAVPGNTPSVEVQKQFIREYEELRKEPDSVTLFGDGMHLIHQNLPGNCWADPYFPPIIETNSGRNRLNILGAYNPETCSFIHVTGEENCNAETVIKYLELISKSYAGIPRVNLILDNARYFHAKSVREWLEENNHIQVKFLPAYAPNLNLTERFWKYTKKKLVKSKYYKKYKEFRAKTFQFLNHVNEHYEDLKQLMVEKFEIVIPKA